MHLPCCWVLAMAFVCSPVWADDEPSHAPTEAETLPKAKPVDAPSSAEVEQAIQRGIEFLLKRQNGDGSWGSVNITRPSDIHAPVPGAHQAFRAAVTSLCISALIETGGGNSDVAQALDRAETWLFANLPNVRRATPDTFYNSWTHAYSIQALAHMQGRRMDDAERSQRIRDLIEHQIGMLERYEVVDGGWAYYDFNSKTKKPSGSTISFVTAAALVSLYEAKQAGVEIPEAMIERAKASILRQRKPDFSYLYGEYTKWRPMMPVNRPAEALAVRRPAT